MDEILTQRLCLRAFRADDLPAFVAYRSEPEVARYQSWDTSYSMVDAGRFLASQRDAELGTPGEWVQLAAVGRRSGTLCGDCAVRVVTDQPATAEVGVAVHRLLERLGFRCEARLVEAEWFKGEWSTLRVFAVLEREWTR